MLYQECYILIYSNFLPTNRAFLFRFQFVCFIAELCKFFLTDLLLSEEIGVRILVLKAYRKCATNEHSKCCVFLLTLNRSE